MSYAKQSSSTIIFQEEENEEQGQSWPVQEPITKTNSDVKQKPTVIELEPNIIKIKSTPRLKNRSKVIISNAEVKDKGYKEKNQKKVEKESKYGQGEEEWREDKSETSSNKETKPTKTLDEHQVEEEVQEIILDNFQSSLYSRNRRRDTGSSQLQRQKEKEEENADSIHPRKARRQLGSSDEDGEIKQKEQQYEPDSESENSQQEYERELAEYKSRKSKGKQEQAVTTRRKLPSVQIAFGREKLQRFINTTIRPGFQVQCIIEMETGFFGIGNKYHLKQKFQPKVLLSAKKELMSLTPKIILSLSKENHSRRNEDFIGIMEANFAGTKWSLKRPIVPAKLNQGEICTDLRDAIFLEYSSSVLGSRSMREMRVYLVDPSLPAQERTKINLAARMETKKRAGLLELVTAKPNLHRGKYQLDFKGLAKMASNKNFILTEPDGQQCLILAKQSETSYQMNIRYPLSLSQGFALCLASLDSKILVN